MKALIRRAGLLLTVLVLAVGCGGEVDVSDEVSAAESAAESAGESVASAAESATSSIAKVSANEASEAELVAALTAAGVEPGQVGQGSRGVPSLSHRRPQLHQVAR